MLDRFIEACELLKRVFLAQSSFTNLGLEKPQSSFNFNFTPDEWPMV